MVTSFAGEWGRFFKRACRNNNRAVYADNMAVIIVPELGRSTEINANKHGSEERIDL